MYTSFFDELGKIAEADAERLGTESLSAPAPFLKVARRGQAALNTLREARALYSRAGGAGGRAAGKKASKAQYENWAKAGKEYSKANPDKAMSKAFAGEKAKADKMYGFWNKYHKGASKPSAMGRLKGALGFKKTSSAPSWVATKGKQVARFKRNNVPGS